MLFATRHPSRKPDLCLWPNPPSLEEIRFNRSIPFNLTWFRWHFFNYYFFKNLFRYHCTRNCFHNSNNPTACSHASYLHDSKLSERTSRSVCRQFTGRLFQLCCAPPLWRPACSERKNVSLQASQLRERSEACSLLKRKNKEISLCNDTLLEKGGERRRDDCKLFCLMPQLLLWKFCLYELRCSLKIKQCQG